MLAIAAYQIAVRIGWIFKTETIIMPAVLDAVAEAGVLRGLLPVLARFGQSLPPLAFAGRLAAMPIKKRALFVTTLSMAACFGLLAWAWDSLAATHPGILAGIFLAAYAAFAVSNGLNQLVVAALQGKLIDVPHRGRLMVLSTAVGSVLAILAAVLLLQGWLDAGPAGFTRVFAATAIFFLIAAAVPVLIDEPSTPLEEYAPPRRRGLMRAAGRELRRWQGMLARDPALVKLCLVAAFFSVALFLFPHYQAFARDQLRTGLPSLLVWLVAQNVTTGLASLVAGPATDRRGTRIVLIGLLACTGITPLLVVGLSLLPREIAGSLFWLVYVPLGINPLLMRTFSNAALEFAPSLAEQPRAVSLVGVSLAAPFVVSPLVGWLVDVVGFRPVFLCGAGVIAVGVWLATGLPEPRQRGGEGRS
jgi:MFS family permease